MINKNIDGIKSTKQKIPNKKEPVLVRQKIRLVGRMDGISKQKINQIVYQTRLKRKLLASTAYVVPFYQAEKKNFLLHNFVQKLYASKKVPVLAIVVALIIAFTGGMWAALNTTKTAAIDVPEASRQADNFSVLLDGGQIPVGATVSNDVLFNTPIEYLKNYLASTSEPDIIKQRADQLTQFLKDRNSPLVNEAETIAQQTHWKLILAIAFAESTLGKHCYEFNCSGIGGSQIKTYSSSKQWIVDFNRLLEKRYKDKTLEQMCGVYVQPCNQNWLLATGQILSSLEEKGIR